MYLQKVEIAGYKCFGETFNIEFSPGLSVLVGENAVGKTAVVDAVRLLLSEDEYGRSGIVDSDFCKSFEDGATRAREIKIIGRLTDLSKDEMVCFMPWLVGNNSALLTLSAENKESRQGRYRKDVWGGPSRASAFEPELFDRITCIYLPALRDAQSRLREGKASRLARLLKNLTKQEQDRAALEEKVKKFNDDLAADKNEIVNNANELIRNRLLEALGSIFGQDTLIRFSEVNFNRIVENLRLLFFPRLDAKPRKPDLFRTLEENSLGYNNLLYLATVMAELTDTTPTDQCLKILLIEEPEAHLHPQLQTRLLRYLEAKAKEASVQVIVTTHSPVLAAAASLDAIIHMTSPRQQIVAVPIKKCGLEQSSKDFLGRWLDVTKSTLLFARGVLLVEGISEAMVVPELAKRVLRQFNESQKAETRDTKGTGYAVGVVVVPPDSLEDYGVSVINMNGIYFKHFMPLFCDFANNQSDFLPVRCAGITDQDPPSKVIDEKRVPFFPTAEETGKGVNPALGLIPAISNSEWSRLYPNELKTFEYDLALEGENLQMMLEVGMSLVDSDGPIKKKYQDLLGEDWGGAKSTEKRDAAAFLYAHIDDDKGAFGQALALELQDEKIQFEVPAYIRKAIMWACGLAEP